MPVGVPRAGDTKFEVLEAVSDHMKSSRKGPTVAEIRDKVGLNARSSIQFHINDLIEDRYLVNVPGISRSLRVTEVLLPARRGFWRALASWREVAGRFSYAELDSRICKLESALVQISQRVEQLEERA